jgi:hypothetical protein
MANIWLGPPGGKISNGGRPWRRGDPVNLLLQVDSTDLQSLVLSGGTLPPGLLFDQASHRVQGTIGALDKSKSSYDVVFRATTQAGRFYDRSFQWQVNPVDEAQGWTSQATKDLGTWNRGANINISLDISNPDADPLTYEIVGARGPAGSFSGLPHGLSIDRFGRIIGSPTISENLPGVYWFRVYVRDPSDLAHDPRQEGNPRTSEKVFTITLSDAVVSDPRLSDVVRWITPAGSLGSTYETLSSHFAVEARPQYEVNEGSSTDVQLVRYTIIPTSKPLPGGLILEPLTGLIVGRCPYVNSTKIYEFTIEARVVFQSQLDGTIRQSSIASQRTFSLTVRNTFTTDQTTTLQISVPANVRAKIATWVWGNKSEARTTHELTVLGRNNLFRFGDPAFGRRNFYTVPLVSGLNYTDTVDLAALLRDYHGPTTLNIGEVKTARALDPEGNYIHDMIYLAVEDPLQGAGGFDQDSKEQDQSRYRVGQKATGIPQWNLKPTDHHYWAGSLKNRRLDLIQTSNRIDWSEQGETANKRGLGLSGREGLPLWMTCEQVTGRPQSILGWIPAIELACVRPGLGAGVVKSLKQAGIEKELGGLTIQVDRYLLLTDGYVSTTFDGIETQDVTGFDGTENTLTPTLTNTTFDQALVQESKYYRFPRGDQEAK